MAGWGTFLGKIAEQFQGRVERLKNEKVSLINERKFIMSKEFSASGSRRVAAIDDRLQAIEAILSNNAKD